MRKVNDMRERWESDNKPWLFFILTFGWSWSFLLPAAGFGLSADQTLTTILRVLAGVGPALIALILLIFPGDLENWKDYWQRLISFRRIKIQWWILILLFPVVLTLVSGGLDLLLGGAGLGFEQSVSGRSGPIDWLGFAIFILAFGPLPEEMGWRGYALDGLQDRMGPAASSFVLGLAWALWHLPLFFIQGTYQANLGVFTPAFWIFLVKMIPSTLLMTWVYNNNRRSTLSAVGFHFAINLTGEVFSFTRSGEWIDLTLWIMSAGLVILLTDMNTFQKKKKEFTKYQ